MTGLLSVSLLFGLVALFGPTVGAVVVSWADGSLVELRAARHHVAVAAVLPDRPRHPVRGQRRGRRPVDARRPRRAGARLGQRDRDRHLRPRHRRGDRLAGVPAAAAARPPEPSGRRASSAGSSGASGTCRSTSSPARGSPRSRCSPGGSSRSRCVMAFVVERARFSILVATVMHGAANISHPAPAAGCRPHMDAGRHRSALHDRRRSAGHPFRRHEPAIQPWLGSSTKEVAA